MKFLSDILAKAGLTVDGVVTLNNTATGQTPATNDNSTKLATTEFIKNQSYLSANQTITVSGDATGSGTTSIILTLANSGVTAGVYGNASNIPTITVDAKGRITSISTNAVSIVTTLAGLSDVTLTSPSANQVLQYNGTQWVNGAAPTTYSLPIATSSILGGIKVGTGLSIDPTTGVLTATGGGGGNVNFRTIQEFTSTAGQTTYTISGGYTVGYVEVLVNGVYISENQYTATNGTTIVLTDPNSAGDIVTVFLYSLYNLGESTYARNVDTLTATAGQTSFTTSYIPGQIDVYYNGSKLTAAEYTATTGSSIVLAQAAVSGDIIEVVTYLAGAGINASRTLTINGTTYDLTANRTWTLTTANISEVTNLYYTDARVATYLTTNSYATQSYVGTQLANLVASAPSTLDTLNELASALGNDPSFATTVATSIGTKVPQTRTITINGTAYDLSADRSWTIASGVTSFNTRTGAITAASGDYTTAQVTESGNLYYTDTRVRAAISLTTTGTSGAATYDSATGIFNIPQYQGGVTSFNTRTGAITLSSSDVTTALTYTPVTNARTLTINGTTYDLTADRSWSIAAGVTSFNTRTGAISLTSLDVTDALTYIPVTNARTITINGTSYDLTADRSWTIAPDVSVRNTYAFTATAAQTTFTVSGGYTVGLVDVFINGVKLAAADFTATNGTTVVLGTGTGVGNIVEIVKYVSAFTTAVETTRTLTINGTTYDLSANRTWSIDNASLGAQAALNGTGLVRMSGTTVSYDNATYATQSYVTTAVANLVNSAPSTLDTLNELATALGNDANFATTITTSIGTKQAQLNGTGFVKISGTTISYDNSTYLTTASASSTYQTILTNPVTGTGTTNYLPKFTGTSTIGNSLISDDGTTVSIQRTAGDLELSLLAGSTTVAGNSILGLYAGTGAGNLVPYGTIKVSPDAAGNTRAAKMVFGVRQSGGALLDALTINSSGNLGLGVTPSAWSGITALQIGGYASFGGDSSFVTYVSSNAYYNAGWKYIGVSAAANYYQDAGGHYFRSTSTTGTAGGAITWITPLTIASTGAATFSDRIQITSNGGTNPVLAIRQTNAANQGYDFETEDVSVGRLDLYGVTHTGRVHMMSWIKATGNVGIGTLSPYSNAKLQVRTGTNINLAFQTGTTDSSGIKLNAFNDAGSANIPFELNGSILYFKTAESERMRLTTTGPTTMGCLLVNKTTASSSYTIQTTSTNGAFMASATGPGDANYYSTSPTIGYHIYGDQGGAAKFNVTGGGKGYFAAGVQFGSGSSTLNYYQEGTWTPQLYAGSSAFTMSGINDGRYVRVGNQVTVTGHLQWSSGSGSGMVKITGLPFACSGVRSAGSMGAVSYGLSFNAGYNHWVLVIDPGADFIYIIQGDSTGAGYSHTPPVGGSGTIYGFSITYHTL